MNSAVEQYVRSTYAENEEYSGIELSIYSEMLKDQAEARVKAGEDVKEVFDQISTGI